MIYNIADRIRYLRDKAGMTQTDLANRLGISRSAVNSWEMSFSSPSLANIIEMTQLFHVSADYLLSLSDKITIDISSLSNEEKEIVIRLVRCFEDNKKSWYNINGITARVMPFMFGMSAGRRHSEAQGEFRALRSAT